MDHKELIAQAKQRGFGKIVKVLREATILHEGWEMDNKAWLVEMADGTTDVLTTSHGGVYPWSREKAAAKLEQAESSATSIRELLAAWPV